MCHYLCAYKDGINDFINNLELCPLTFPFISVKYIEFVHIICVSVLKSGNYVSMESLPVFACKSMEIPWSYITYKKCIF